MTDWRKTNKENRRKWFKQVDQYAKELNEKLPKSEVWFQSIYNKVKDPDDKYNHNLQGTIPDVYNNKFKYIIEIDGSIHQDLDVIKNDERKTKKYNKLGFKVIRIVAYDYESLKLGLEKVFDKRKLPDIKVSFTQENGEVFTYNYKSKTTVVSDGSPKKKTKKPRVGNHDSSVKYIIRKASKD